MYIKKHAENQIFKKKGEINRLSHISIGIMTGRRYCLGKIACYIKYLFSEN